VKYGVLVNPAELPKDIVGAGATGLNPSHPKIKLIMNTKTETPNKNLHSLFERTIMTMKATT